MALGTLPVSVGVHGFERAEFFCLRQLFLIQIDGDDVRADGRRDVYRGESDATATVDGDPIARVHVGPVNERVERGHEPTTESGHRHRRYAVGKDHRVLVGHGDVDFLGERARNGFGEAERKEVLADVRVAVPTLRTGSVAEGERDGDAVALGQSRHVLAHLDHGPGGFVAQNLPFRWFRAYPVPVALPRVPVASADATGVRLYHDAVRVGFRPRHLLDSQGLAVLV